MTPARETIMVALWTLLLTMRPGTFKYMSRRLKRWTDVPDKPALCLSENGEGYDYQSENLPKQTIELYLFIYIQAGQDPEDVPAIDMNNILDALDTALAPDRDGRLTLGGLVSHCYISGEVTKVPGDIDGEGLAVVPLRILVP